MNCKDCITMAKCCGNTFADGTCRGCTSYVTVPCPQHAIEKVAHLVPQQRESEAA